MLPVLPGGRVTVPLCTNVFLLFSFFLMLIKNYNVSNQKTEESSLRVIMYCEYSWTVRKLGFITFSKYFGAIPV